VALAASIVTTANFVIANFTPAGGRPALDETVIARSASDLRVEPVGIRGDPHSLSHWQGIAASLRVSQ
jgi:hypothetical protein